jgi:hypothetical protein
MVFELSRLTAALLVLSAAAAHAGHDVRACTTTATLLKQACHAEASDDAFHGAAVCANLAGDERRSCLREVASAYAEARGECGEVDRARRELCGDVGEDRYAPAFGEDYADQFVDPRTIGHGTAVNPYLPLVVGTQWVYEGTHVDDEGEEVTERIVVTVTDRTKRIDGIDCLVVNDRVEVDDEVVEDTDDWVAQDLDGTVWYCGELARNFEFFEGDDPEEAELVDIDGSFKAGRDGALPGILMPAVPVVGDFFRQEAAWGDAEDVIEVLNLSGSASTTAADCDGDCLVTRDFTPLEPEVEENKYYKPGIGKILEIDLETGERVELVEYVPGG